MVYYCDRKAVVSFAAHSLDRRSAEAWLRGKLFVEATHSLDIRIVTSGINHCSVTHNIIGDDQAAVTGKLERPCQIIWIVWFICVNKNQVKYMI